MPNTMWMYVGKDVKIHFILPTEKKFENKRK
jgi:hypothetical protein